MVGYPARCADRLTVALTPVQANVEMMLDYLPLTAFKAIYVVDLCSSLCAQVLSGSGVLVQGLY